MAQRVEFSFFPGVRDELLWSTVNKVFGHVRRNTMTLRDFRDWLKDAGLWQKEEAPALLGFLDVQLEPEVQLGPWAQGVLGAKDDAAARDLLYKRLCDENLLLCKYVLEALDVDGGGRLHSTSELHRMLTSYVYPGKHVGRVAFEAWIKWMVASGRVRLIGIRWGLTELGKQAVPRLRTVDADEFLEDEGRPIVAASVPPPAAAKPAAKAPTPAAGAADDEELPDLPPEAEPVDELTFAAHEARLAQPSGQTAPGPLAAAAAPEAASLGRTAGERAQPGQLTRTGPQSQARAPALTLDLPCQGAPADAAEVIAALRDAGRQRGLGGGSLLLGLGLESRLAQHEPGRHLFVAALLARCWHQPDGQALAGLVAERAGGWGPVALLLDRPEALVDCLTRWQLTGSDAAAARARAVLLEATLGGRAQRAAGDLPAQLAAAPSSEALLAALHAGLLGAVGWPEAFWLVREMVRAGLWTHPSATEVAFVPTRPVRLMAYRLRLIDSHFAESLPAYITTARRLAALLPPGSVEAAAMEALAPDDHLRFDCARVVICQDKCALASTGAS